MTTSRHRNGYVFRINDPLRGNPLVIGGFPHTGPVIWSFNIVVNLKKNVHFIKNLLSLTLRTVEQTVELLRTGPLTDEQTVELLRIGLYNAHVTSL